ncbi:MAG: hypothetical protein HKN32_08850 [Flavobacteriales bacterium]|nr:hypothetical protein [Flavobacteriales bacterium]
MEQKQTFLIKIGVAIVALFGFLWGLSVINLIDLKWPFSSPLERETTVTQIEPATIYQMSAIGIDCREYTAVAVPTEGKNEHKADLVLWKPKYRTDTILMTVYGDVEACVPTLASTVLNTADGRVVVEVDATQIEWNRPRPDAEKTLAFGDINVNQGWVGEITDIIPFVSDNLGLKEKAYAFGQAVIGSSECFSVAWDQVRQAIEFAYIHLEAERNNVDPSQVSVKFLGEPNFDQHVQPEDLELEGVKFRVLEGGSCQVKADSLQLDEGDLIH